MSYADGDAVRLRLQAVQVTVTDELLEEGLTASDEIIDTTVPGSPFTGDVPNAIARAATYYAAMDIIDIIFTNVEARNAIATTYENRALKILAPFL